MRQVAKVKPALRKRGSRAAPEVPDADLVGLGVPPPALDIQRASGGKHVDYTPFPVLGADPVG